MAEMEIKIQGDKKQSFMSLLLELQEIVSDAIHKVIDHYGKIPIEPSNWVAIVILKRLIESTKAGTLLISHDFYRDAAVLITNMIELRLDMQYISQDHRKAQVWLKHSDTSKKPWKVRMLFEGLFKNSELEAERNVYMKFSMVKHGNPVAETFAFPLAVKNDYLTISSQEDILSGNFSLYAFIFFNELFRTFKVAAIDFKRLGFDIQEFENKADFIKMMMDDLYNKNINEQICLLRKITPIPELCKSCVVVPKNHIEITCLLKQKEHADKFSCEKYKSQ
jgi:hypothetical protein